MGSGVRWRGGRAPSPTSVERGARVPSAHRRPGYPSPGCVPAAPDSVSPGGPTVTSTLAWSKSKGLGRADNARLARCTPEPWWVPFARRCGPLLLADYHRPGKGHKNSLHAVMRQHPDVETVHGQG